MDADTLPLDYEHSLHTSWPPLEAPTLPPKLSTYDAPNVSLTLYPGSQHEPQIGGVGHETIGYAPNYDFTSSPEPRSNSFSSGSWHAVSRSGSQTSVGSQKDGPPRAKFPLGRASGSAAPQRPVAVHPSLLEQVHPATHGLGASDARKTRRRRRPNRSDDERNEIRLEKNRIAANKCRLKQRGYETRLQERFDAERQKRDALMAQLSGLYESILALKEILVLHYDCGDESLTEYLSTELERTKRRRHSAPEQDDVRDIAMAALRASR